MTKEVLKQANEAAIRKRGVTHCQCEACKNGNIHDSDCAIHNGNALPVGPCDCSLAAPPLLVQEDSCFCHSGVSLQSVSGGAAPEGYLGKVTLLIDGEYVDYVKAQPPPPVQESVSMRMPKVGDKVICLEDESLGEVVSLTAGGSPDILFADGSHGTYLLREFAELFGYVASPLPVQRPWQGMTKQDMPSGEDPMFDHQYFIAGMVYADKVLKERNT